MKLYKVLALVYNDMRVFRNMKYKPVELFYFPITTIIIWGLFSTFVRDRALEAGLIVLVVNIFYSFAQSAQSGVNRTMMEDMWSSALKHIFVSGITSTEYILARMISSAVFSLVMVAIILGLSFYAFGAAVIVVSFAAVMTFIVLTLLASMALSILVAGMILNAGREYGFLSWTSIQIFVLLSAPFYPVEIFPQFLQPVAWAMPFTSIFEGVRHLISTGAVGAGTFVNSLAVTTAYAIFSFAFYTLSFRRARRNGTLARIAG
jgi:ABC-2 type transport system permease protein